MPAAFPSIASRLRLTPHGFVALVLAALLASFLVAQVRLVVQRDGAFYSGTDVPVGADFLVFYTGGRIVAAGDGASLYDPARQIEEQRVVLGRERGLAIFPYPAFVAAPYALLSGLPLAVAYGVAAAAMMAAAGLAVWMLRKVSPTVREQPLLAFLAVMISEPFNTALLGGQTVAFTLLCFAGTYTALRQERRLAAGIWLGLLCYKPQMAFLLVLMLLLRRRWRELAVAAVVVVGLAALGAAVAGPEWPARFWALTTGDFYQDNALAADGFRSISLPALFAHLAGRHSLVATLITALACVAIVAVLAAVWRYAEPRSESFPLQFAAVIGATLLVSPHALFYEAGLLVLPVLLLIDRWRESGWLSRPWRALALAALFALGYLWPFAEKIAVEPLALLPVIGTLLVLHELGALRVCPAGTRVGSAHSG